MESIEVVAILIGILLIAGVSKHLRGTIITLPMLYTLFSLFVGYLFSDLIDLSIEDAVVHIIAELTLVFVLATDASRLTITSQPGKGTEVLVTRPGSTHE